MYFLGLSKRDWIFAILYFIISISHDVIKYFKGEEEEFDWIFYLSDSFIGFLGVILIYWLINLFKEKFKL